MAVEAFVAVAQRRDDGCYLSQLVEHPIDVDIARVHHQVDALEDLENRRREMLARFRYMSI